MAILLLRGASVMHDPDRRRYRSDGPGRNVTTVTSRGGWPHARPGQIRSRRRCTAEMSGRMAELGNGATLLTLISQST